MGKAQHTPGPGKARYCWNCGADLGFIEDRLYDRRFTCGARECDRAAWRAAAAERDRIETERAALLRPTAAAYFAAQEALALVEERTGEPECTCEACGEPVFPGEPWMGGETPLCGACAPTYADLLGDLGSFVMLDENGEYVPMTPEHARALYDAHISGGGKPTDSMARARFPDSEVGK